MRKQILIVAIAISTVIASATSSYAVKNITNQQCNQVDCVGAQVSTNTKQQKPSIETQAKGPAGPGRRKPPKIEEIPRIQPFPGMPQNQIGQNKPPKVSVQPIDAIQEIQRKRPAKPGG